MNSSPLFFVPQGRVRDGAVLEWPAPLGSASALPEPFASTAHGEPVLQAEHLPALQRALTVVGDYYCLQLLGLLVAHGCQRFAELEAAIVGISPRTLSGRLKRLERDGLIHRQVHASTAPRVDYSLTPEGLSLVPVLLQLVTWAETTLPTLPLTL